MERSIGHRAPVLWLLLPTMGGFGLARALPAGWGGGWWLVLAVLGLGVAGWGLRRRRSGALQVGDEAPTARGIDPDGWNGVCWAVGVAVAVGAAACSYYQLRENRLAIWERLPPREAELVLEVDRVFPRVAGRVTTSGLARIVRAPPLVAETVGQRVFFAVQVPDDVPGLVRSERLRARGVLAPLDRRAEEGFEGYLASSGAAFKFNRARWLGRDQPPNAYRKYCAEAAMRFEAILGLGLEDRTELRAVLVAMLLGRRAELDEGQRELFLHSGTMHLFAVSGLHIGVIAGTLVALVLLLRVPRLAGVVGGLALLYLHVQITGGSASAMRAWLMIAFVFGAGVLRWARNPLAGIAASALVVLWWDPWQLFGLGFRMSYAVVVALLLYGLVLDERLQRRWRPGAEVPTGEWRWRHYAVEGAGRFALSCFSLGVAATLVGLPMTVALFGLLTPGALVVNLVCIPVASLAIVAGVASIVAGLAGLTPLSVLFNHAGALVILAMESGLAWAVRVPGMYWAAEFRTGWLGGATVLALLVAMTVGYARRWRGRMLGLWSPVVLLAVLLAVAVRHGSPAGAESAEDLPAEGGTAIAAAP